MGVQQITESRLKKRVQELINQNDPALSIRQAGSKGGALARSICATLGLDHHLYGSRVAKILLNKATANQIDVYRGTDKVTRPDAEAIKFATRVRKHVANHAPASAIRAVTTKAAVVPPMPGPSSKQIEVRAALTAKLGQHRWTKQQALMRDVVFWFLWNQPGHRVVASTISRKPVLEAAGMATDDKNVLQALSNCYLFLETQGLIRRKVNGKVLKELELLVELDDITVSELREQFGQEKVEVSTQPSDAPAAEQTLPVAESTEDMIRRVIREELERFDLAAALGLNVVDISTYGRRLSALELRLHGAAKALEGGDEVRAVEPE